MSICLLHVEVVGGEAEKAGHADVERSAALDVLLPAQCVHEWGRELAGKRDHFVVCTQDTSPGEAVTFFASSSSAAARAAAFRITRGCDGMRGVTVSSAASASAMSEIVCTVPPGLAGPCFFS